MNGRSELVIRQRNLGVLAALAALFLLPVVLSFWIYYGTGWRPTGRVNYGSLIAPARPLPAVALPEAEQGTPASPFHEKWTLVYVGDGRCDAACQEALQMIRQTRLLLTHDMTRLQRVFLATGQCCAREFLGRAHPGLIVLNATGSAAAPLLATFPANEREHTVFVVDPLGNLMMSYDARQNPRGLLLDLQKLLRLSHIG